MLIEDKDYFGIDAIEYDNKIELSEEEISARYKLCSLIKGYLIGETYISNTDIMAVLYKIRFAIIKACYWKWEFKKRYSQWDKIKIVG